LLLLTRLRSAFFSGCLIATFAATFLIAGCAHPPGTKGLSEPISGFWAGRLSLQVHSEPAQSFSASFELKGQPERGELTLISPLGNVLSVLRWSPGEAVLDSGNEKLQHYPSIDALTEQATGAALPLAALFGWLQGEHASVNGWSADLSRHSEGRISAKRAQPTPPADLRVVLDQ
jgi:outer membrane lipoprotein LolB